MVKKGQERVFSFVSRGSIRKLKQDFANWAVHNLKSSQVETFVSRGTTVRIGISVEDGSVMTCGDSFIRNSDAHIMNVI